MPTFEAAIEGIPNKRRIQEKAKRLALENLQTTSRAIPHWTKTFSPEEMKQYVLDNATNLANMKSLLGELAWMIGILRDVLLLKQEESDNS